MSVKIEHATASIVYMAVVINCTAGTEVIPLGPQYYYVKELDYSYLLTPDLRRIPAGLIEDISAKCGAIDYHKDIVQRGEKLHIMCQTKGHVHTLIADHELSLRETLSVGVGKMAMSADGKLIGRRGIFDVDTGAVIHSASILSLPMEPLIKHFDKKRLIEGLGQGYLAPLASRGYVVMRRNAPLSVQYIHDRVEISFDHAVVRAYRDPAAVVFVAQNKFAIIECEYKAESRFSLEVESDALTITYRRNIFERYACRVSGEYIAAHPVARNVELLRNIVAAAIAGESELELRIFNPPGAGNVTLTITFLQKYAPDPLMLELIRSDRV